MPEGGGRRRWKRLAIAAGVVLAVVVALGVGVRLLTAPSRVARLVCEQLGRELGCHVRVGSAELGLLSGLEIRGLELREAPEAEPEELGDSL